MMDTCQQFDQHKWNTDRKFHLQNGAKVYQAEMQVKEDDKQTLRDVIMRTKPRFSNVSYDPFLDRNEEATSMIEKWKKRLATIAMNDDLPPNNHLAVLCQKEITKNCVTEKKLTSDMNHEKETTLDLLSNPGTSKMNHFLEYRKTQLPNEQEQMNLPASQPDMNDEKQSGKAIQAKNCQEVDMDSQSSFSSMNVLDYVASRKKSYKNIEEKMLNHTFVMYPKNSKSFKQDSLNEGMISKRKYVRLLNKYKLLKEIFREQRDQYAKDTRIQHLAQCLYKAIEERYSEEEAEDG